MQAASAASATSESKKNLRAKFIGETSRVQFPIEKNGPIRVADRPFNLACDSANSVRENADERPAAAGLVPTDAERRSVVRAFGGNLRHRVDQMRRERREKHFLVVADHVAFGDGPRGEPHLIARRQ